MRNILNNKYDKGCLICGKQIIYIKEEPRECQICHKEFVSAAVCVDGHYVCDECHKAVLPDYMEILINSKETAPIKLLNGIMNLPGMHMHGPEHHVIVPCVLLTCYKNSSLQFDLNKGLRLAVERGRHIQGGSCGFWGACGAAIGAGIFASIVTDSNPLNIDSWGKPQGLTADILRGLSDMGGVRCCKRTSYTAVRKAVKWTYEYLGVKMEDMKIECTFNGENMECLGSGCPYYGGPDI